LLLSFPGIQQSSKLGVDDAAECSRVMKSVASFALLALLSLAGCSQDASPPAAAKPAAKPTQSAAAPSTPTQDQPAMKPTSKPVDKLARSEEEWKKTLTPEQYHVLREKGTERAFSGKYWDTKTPGVYKCAACGAVLFSSDAKFDSGCGWPSFDKMLADGAIEEHTDTSFGMTRTEVTCARCGGHLGHVFDDGPTSTHLRYCINSASIDLEEGKPPTPKPDGK
jgi:peptide-methionine (R)-S-oxide reductase